MTNRRATACRMVTKRHGRLRQLHSSWLLGRFPATRALAGTQHSEHLPMPQSWHVPAGSPLAGSRPAAPRRFHDVGQGNSGKPRPNGCELLRSGSNVRMVGLPLLQLGAGHGDGPAPTASRLPGLARLLLPAGRAAHVPRPGEWPAAVDACGEEGRCSLRNGVGLTALGQQCPRRCRTGLQALARRFRLPALGSSPSAHSTPCPRCAGASSKSSSTRSPTTGRRRWPPAVGCPELPCVATSRT